MSCNRSLGTVASHFTAETPIPPLEHETPVRFSASTGGFLSRVVEVLAAIGCVLVAIAAGAFDEHVEDGGAA